MTKQRSNLINVGRVSSVFGVKGWLKIRSNTEPEENIVNYPVWWLKTKHGVKAFEVDEFKHHNSGLVVHFKNLDDRDEASELKLVDIAIERDALPGLPEGEYYWDQLIGMRVVSHYAEKVFDFGIVTQFMETGANDVLVIHPDAESFDDKERLVPYVPDMYVKSVDIKAGAISVEWDPEF